jgi:DNA-binding XRE family transcriptional regulator
MNAAFSPAQLRAGRALLDWNRSDLSAAARVSAETIKNIEHGTFKPQADTVQKIIAAFAAHRVEFVWTETHSAQATGVMLVDKMQSKQGGSDAAVA